MLLAPVAALILSEPIRMGNLDAAHCCCYFHTIRALQKWATLMLLIVVAILILSEPVKNDTLIKAHCRFNFDNIRAY